MSNSSEKTFLKEVLDADPEYYKEKAKEPAYIFSNKRKFLCSDSAGGGVYEDE